MRKNIALFVSYLDNEFSMEIIDGAWLASEEFDVNLFILPTRLLIDNYFETDKTKYQYQFNTMLSYVDKGNFDGVIMETGVICNAVTDTEVKKLFDGFDSLPVVSISRKVDGYADISLNCQGLRDEIQHLIDKHGCRHIGFFGGPAENAEAIERFELYKKVLADNGLEYDEKLCGNGNFSEFCETEVKNILSENMGKIDALCFANDRMAIGGYKAIEEMGLTVGKDICIVGFDDAPSAAAMEPPLTTVRSNVFSLGYRALEQCVAMIGGKSGSDISVDTAQVIRNSCGCLSGEEMILEKINGMNDISPDELCSEIYTMLAGAHDERSQVSLRLATVGARFSETLKNLRDSDFDIDRTVGNLMRAIDEIDFDIIPYDEFMVALNLLRKKALETASDKQKASEMFFELFTQISCRAYSDLYDNKRDLKKMTRMSAYIVYDVLLNINDEASSYLSIIRNIRRHNTESCYMFIHDFPITCHNYKSWHRPRNERLMCYHNRSTEAVLPQEERKMASESMFRNKYMPKRRHTFVVSPLCYNEEHYGLLLCEMSKKDYTYLTMVMLKQISYALKMKQMMEEQTDAQERLSQTVELVRSYNLNLQKLSVSDALTGVFNRRGFYDNVEEQLFNPMNCGRKAAIIFADINYLKQINDTFGHDDGDFAIKNMARILVRCSKPGDIVARFGGDEFVMFCMTDSSEFTPDFYSKLKETVDEANRGSSKPYLITASAGVYNFVCDAKVNLSECMNNADALLYENKKNKPKTIIR